MLRIVVVIAVFFVAAFGVETDERSNSSSSTYGVDISAALSASTASCFVSNGVSYVIPRGFRSTGAVDTNVCNSIKTAASAGIKTRDTYIFPCPTCSSSAATQMSQLVSYLNTNCKSDFSGRIWLDIEGSEYWLGSSSKNQEWYKQLKDACSSYSSSGIRCGVYASKTQWENLFGSSSFVYGSELPLWYAHYDNKQTFSDFTSFGGWSTPYAKQYQGSVSVCSLDVDTNYAPAF